MTNRATVIADGERGAGGTVRRRGRASPPARDTCPTARRDRQRAARGRRIRFTAALRRRRDRRPPRDDDEISWTGFHSAVITTELHRRNVIAGVGRCVDYTAGLPQHVLALPV